MSKYIEKKYPLESLKYVYNQEPHKLDNLKCAIRYDKVELVEYMHSNKVSNFKDWFVEILNSNFSDYFNNQYELDVLRDENITERMRNDPNYFSDTIQILHDIVPRNLNETDLEYYIRVELSKLTSWAAAFGKLECLKILIKYGYSVTTNAYSNAASGQHFEIIKYIYENKLAKWSKKNSVFINYDSFRKNIGFKILEYMHENGCSWDKKTIITIVKYYDIKSLKYAIKNGCDFDEVCLC